MKFVTDDSVPARPLAFVRSTDALLLIAALLLVGLYAAAASGGFPLDDSWIHQVYGRNLAQTGLWAFVPGAPSAASTAPLYTVLLAAGYTLGVPFKLWTHGLGALALAAAGLTGARLAARLMPEQRYIGLAAGLALVGTWHLVWAAASGMETMLFSLWTLALMLLGWDAPDGGWRRGALFGASAALAALTRPEGVLLAGLVGAAVLAARLPAGWRRWLPWMLGAGAGFVVCIAPYLILNLQLTGGLLPNTAAAKQAEYATLTALLPYPRRLWEMFRPIFAGGQILLLPGLVYFVAVAARRLRADREKLLYLLPVGWALALVALYAARLPAPYQHGRYVIPALPALVLVGVVGTAWMLRESRRTLAGRVVSRALAAASALAFGYFALAGAAIYSRDVDIIDEEMVTAAQWIQTHLPPEDRLAVHDIGAVGYFAPRPILDLAGLVNPEIIPFIRDAAALWDWMQANDARYLMAFPDQIPGQNPDDPRLCRVFVTGGQASPLAGGANMAVYALAWDGICPD